MQLEIVGRTLVAHIDGDLDHHCATNIRRELDKILKRSEIKNLILDFSGLDFMDSSGIGLVMGRYRILSRTGAELNITGTSPQIYKVMKLAGIERLAKLEEQ